MALQDNALVTVGELMSALGITDTAQNAAMESFINGCSDAIETLTGRRLVSRTYTEEYLYIRPETVLGIEWLDVEWPITALSTLRIGGASQTIWMPGSAGSPETADVFVLEAKEPKHGRDRIFRPAGWPVGALVARTYTAGYAQTAGIFQIPRDLKQAVLTLAADWFYRRARQSDPVISRSAGAETITYVNEALPRTVPTLINGYRRW